MGKNDLQYCQCHASNPARQRTAVYGSAAACHQHHQFDVQHVGLSVIISNWLEEFMQTSPDIKNRLLEVYSQFSDWAVRWIQDSMLPSLIKDMGGSLMGTVNILKNVIVGIIIAIYVLNSKDLFAAQAKKIAYSIFSTEHANLFIKNTRFVHRVFGGFIIGQTARFSDYRHDYICIYEHV